MRLAAMNLLARRDHSRQELQRKLAVRFDDAAQLAKVLDQLQDDGLQDDERFAQMYVRYRADRGYGQARIRMELRQKGVDDALAGYALDAAGIDWQALLVELHHKKFAGQVPQDTTDKARQMRFFQQRGFSHEGVYRLWSARD